MLEVAIAIGILTVAGYYQCESYGLMTMIDMLAMFIFIVPLFMIKKPRMNFMMWLTAMFCQNWLRTSLYISFSKLMNKDVIVNLEMDSFKLISGQLSLAIFAFYLIGVQIILINKQISMLNKANALEQINLQSRSDDITFITFSTLAFIVYNAFCVSYYSLDATDFKSYFNSMIVVLCSILVLKFVYNDSYRKRVSELVANVPKVVMTRQDDSIVIEDLSDGD